MHIYEQLIWKTKEMIVYLFMRNRRSIFLMYLVNWAAASACWSQQFHNELKMHHTTLFFEQILYCYINYNIRNCYLGSILSISLCLIFYIVWQKILQNPLIIPKFHFPCFTKKCELKEWIRQDHLNLSALIKYTDVQSRRSAKTLGRRSVVKCVVMLSCSRLQIIV